MEGTLTYPRNIAKPYLLDPGHGVPKLFTEERCWNDEGLIRVEGFAGYGIFVYRTAAGILDSVKRYIFNNWFDDSMPHLNIAVDCAEQL